MHQATFEPKRCDVTAYAGDPAPIVLEILDRDGKPLPIKGRVRADIRADRSSDTVLDSFAVDLTLAGQGIITLKLTAAQTRNLIGDTDRFQGVWDAEWQPTTGEPRTLLHGNISCTLDVTR